MSALPRNRIFGGPRETSAQGQQRTGQVRRKRKASGLPKAKQIQEFILLRCGRCAPSDQLVSYANGISALVLKMLVLP
jgi:hypothetical protein